MKFNGPFRPVHALLSALIAVSGVFCLSTGFALAAEPWLPVVLFVAAFALLCELSFCYKRGFLIFFAVSLAACLLTAERIMPSVEYLLYTISRYYDGGYGWGILRWSDTPFDVIYVNPALIFTGCLITMPLVWTLHRRKWVGFGLFVGILPFAACCVVTDTLPSAICLLGLLVGLLLLLLTQLHRRQNPDSGNRLMALLLIPVVLFASLLTVSSLRTSHAGQAQALQNEFKNLFSRSQNSAGTGLTGNVGIPSSQVNLSTLGPRDPGDQVVMQVQADHNGIVYLRGQSYDTYTGTRWKSTLDTAGEGGWPQRGMVDAGEITITTVSRHNLKYFPYYIFYNSNDKWTDDLGSGSLDNPGRKTSYSFPWMIPGDGNVIYAALDTKEQDAYLALPESTWESALEILGPILGSLLSTEEKAVHITNFVRNSAVYDLNTPSMPNDASDFAIWFLNEGDTGYCVHFASAATVLLRAAGIPARYVSGYIAYAAAGVSVDVTAAQAHAWVEYLDPELGWTVLEATPGAENIPEIPVPTETTQPEQTTLPSETTQPEETQPETTQPEQTETAPTQPEESQPSNAPDEPAPTLDLSWLKPLAWIFAFCLLLAGQYILRLRLRMRRLRKGSPNRQALRRWQYVCRLAKLTRQDAPSHLRTLAEKAKFSQHRLTAGELAQFGKWISSTHKMLLEKPQPVRFLLRLILAI